MPIVAHHASQYQDRELNAAQVRRRCDPATLAAAALPTDGADLALIGQERALSALQLGIAPTARR